MSCYIQCGESKRVLSKKHDLNIFRDILRALGEVTSGCIDIDGPGRFMAQGKTDQALLVLGREAMLAIALAVRQVERDAHTGLRLGVLHLQA